MAELQALQIAPSIAELAIKTVELAKRVIQASTDAEELNSRARKARNIVDIVRRVVESRFSNISEDSDVRSILVAITSSIEECNKSLEAIDKVLQSKSTSLPDRLAFVGRQSFLKKQENDLAGSFDTLQLLLILLHTVDSRPHHTREVQSLLGRKDSNEDSTLSSPDTREPVRRVSSTHELASSGDINSVDTNGWTLLHHAADGLESDLVDSLLDLPGAEKPEHLNAVTSAGVTALMLATDHADDPAQPSLVAIKLIKRGCDVNLKDNSGHPASPSCKICTKRCKGIPGRSALHRAVDGPRDSLERAKLVYVLIDGGASVEQLQEDWPEKYDRYKEFEEARPSHEGPRPSAKRQGSIKEQIVEVFRARSNS